MRDGWQFGLALLVTTMTIAPLLLTIRRARAPVPPTNWRDIAGATLAYVFAFNLMFFCQELFLVWPKALVPGLHPILYHNNHDWRGDAPIAELLQGTGALASLVIGAALLAWRGGEPGTRQFTGWLAFAGIFQALPQVVLGTILNGNDVARALTWLELGDTARWLLAVIAIAAMIALARPITRRLGRAIALPAAIGTLLVLPYRVPGSLDQVAVVPIAVALLGVPWLVAWRHHDGIAEGGTPPPLPLFVAALTILALFLLVLRPGIAF